MKSFLVSSAAIVFCFSAAVAQPALQQGFYSTSVGTGSAELVVRGNATYGNDIVMTYKGAVPSRCTGSPWVITNKSHLPPDYSGGVVNATSATCRGEWECQGITIRCAGPGPFAAGTYKQISATQIQTIYGPNNYTFNKVHSRRTSPPKTTPSQDPWSNLFLCPLGLQCSYSK
jgi:hypothetical protein